MRTKFFSLQGGFYFLILLIVSFFASQTTKAQTAYNPGKLAVLVVGDGTAALSGTATPVFIKEFNTSGAGQSGTLRTTLPTTATTGTGSVSRALTQSGSSTSEGMLNLSADKLLLTLTGYNTSSGTAGVSTSVATTFPTNTRVVAKVNASGVADTKTTLNTLYSGFAIRSAATLDGTAFWTAGAPGTVGVGYVTNGNIGSVTNLSATNTRGIGIFNSQLYVSSQSGSVRLAKVGSGLPTSGSPTLTNLNGFLTSTGDPYSFVFIDINGGGPDLLYVASLNTAPSGLLKYSSSDNGATWTARGSLSGNVFGVTGAYNPCSGDVDLYITANTTNAKPNALYKFSDLDVLVVTPANITSNGTALSTAGTLLATTATNTAFGGVAFTPGTLATPPIAFGINGASGCADPGVIIGLNNSEIGVSYQLYNGASATGIAVTGIDGPISFGNQTVAGTYTIVATNQLTGCSVNMTGSRVINASPTVSFTGLVSQYCVDATAVNLTGSPSGGAFSGPGISGNTFNPSVAGAGGPYTITYSYTNPSTGCSKSISQLVTVSPLPVVSFTGLASQYCVTASPVTLTGSPAGGTFSGPGISGNIFNPALAGAGGPYTITYSYTDLDPLDPDVGTGCTKTVSQTVSVGSPSTVNISGNDFVCQGGSTLLTATVTDLSIIISNYQWVVTTIEGLSTLGNAATQSTSQGGTYNVIITNSGGCTTTSPGYSVTAYATPTVNFTGLATTYCSNASPVTLVGSPAGGVFSGPGINGNIFDPALAGAGGPYPIVYSYTIPGTTCSNSKSENVAVIASPSVSFSGLSTSYCVYASTVTLTGSPAGGIFSGPGISGNVFDPATAGPGGPYNITYSVTNIATGCSSSYTQQVSVNAKPTVSVSASSNAICLGGNTNLTLNFTGTAPWNYSINGAATVSTSSNPAIVPVSPVNDSVFAITYFTDANCNANPWVNLSTGSYHSLAIKADGTLWGWGRNNEGQLGNGTNTASNKPVKAGTSSNWAKVATGSVYSLAIKNDGTLWAWGGNDWGQLGTGDYSSRNFPVQIGTANNWAKIEAGNLHSLAIKTDGTLWAWGVNFDGQLGDGTNTVRNSPVQIGISTDWKEISGGTDHSLALKIDGTLWAWGWGVFGQLGGGSASNVPQQRGVATDWASISAGQYFSLGIKTTGTLWAWGNNDQGQLGNGTFFQLNSPTQIGTATNWSKISAASSHSLGIRQNGTLWAWGSNSNGQFGNGTTSSSNVPVQAGSSTDWAFISSGLRTSSGMKTNQSVYSWGENSTGQLGDGSNTDKNIAVQINAAITSITITVNPLPTVNFTGLASQYCVNASAVTLTGSPAGGTFSGPGISGNTFNPVVAGAGGPYTVTYTYTNVSTGCSNSTSKTVTVNPLPIVSFTGLASQYCVNASAVTLTGSQSGGTFSGPGISGNTFNPATAGAGGPYTVTYTYTNISTGCSNSTSQTVTVNPLPIISFTGLASQYCVNASAVTLTGSPSGGTFSGPGIIGNTFNPAGAGAGGPYTVTYTYTNVSTGCSNSTSKTVTVNPLPVVSYAGLASQYCSVALAVTLSGSPAGGTFSGPGIIGNTFDPAAAGAGGPYTISYTYTDPVTSCSNIFTQSVTVNAAQNWYLDADNDGYYVSSILACSSPGAGYNQTATVLGDCNDNNNAIHPGAVDICGNGIDEDCNGSDAICGATLAFDGVNDNVSLPNSLAVSATTASNTAITIEYWFKGSNVQSAVRFQDDNGYIVAGWNTLGQPIHIISTDNGINGIGINPIVNNGNWHHVAMTWEKNTINGFKSYVDGQLYQQRNSANANLPAITSGANLGSYRSVGEFMNGQLDEVRIWNRALCQEEILSRMNCEIAGAETGLLANYHFNEGVAGSINTGINTLSDASGNNYNGTLNNFALSGTTSNWIEPGAVVSGVSCSGIIAAQEINVQGNGLGIADNSTIATTINYTDFGSVIVGGNRVRTFTIQNTGTASLVISGIAMTGTDQSMFTIGALSPASPIAAGNSATFTVTFSATSLGTKTATVVIYNNDCNESVFDFAVEVLSVCPTVSFTGLATTYCADAALVTLTGNPAGGIFSGPGITGNSFNPAVAGTGTHTISYAYADGNGCSDNVSQQVTVNVCTPVYTTLNLTAFLEGFYSEINTMRANIYDLGISIDPSETDTVTVNLWSPESLSNTEPDHSIQAVLHTDGMATIQFPAAVSGNSFYIAVKHRNHIETWSKLPVTFTSITDYNFSTGTNKAYDDGVNAPMVIMPGEVFAFYSGDINQDGGIDGQDMNVIDNEIGFFGYNISDVNGDGGTDGQDMNFVDNNSQLGLFYARPY